MLYLCLFLLFFTSCTSSINNNPSGEIHCKDTIYIKDNTNTKISILKNQLSEFQLKIHYSSKDEINYSTNQRALVVDWVKKIKSNSSLFINNTDFDEHLIIHLKYFNASLNEQQQQLIAKERLNYVEESLNLFIGVELSGNIPLIKTLKEVEHSPNGEDFLIISLNKLLF